MNELEKEILRIVYSMAVKTQIENDSKGHVKYTDAAHNRVAKAVKQGKKMMHKSKCRFCVEGIVLDDDCNNVIGSCYCDIDQYDEEIGCNRSCHGYSVAKAVMETGGSNE